MEDQETHPTIQEVVCNYLTAWRTDQPFPPCSSHFPGVQAALNSQAAVGWQVFLEGCRVADWAEIQQRYYSWLGRRRTGRRWISMLIRKLWDVAWDLWEHRNGYAHRDSTNRVVKFGDSMVKAHSNSRQAIMLFFGLNYKTF
jgi:hypothetical protein